jgi:hypothetical protein
MTHDDIRAWILDASPGALWQPPPEVRLHLGACPACATDLTAVRSGLEDLVRARDGEPSRLDDAAAVRLARGGRRSPTRQRWPRSSRWWTAAASGGALAAVVLAVVARGPESPPPEVADPTQTASAASPSRFAVRVPAGDRLAVFATANPKIHVVWTISEPSTSREMP